MRFQFSLGSHFQKYFQLVVSSYISDNFPRTFPVGDSMSDRLRSVTMTYNTMLLWYPVPMAWKNTLGSRIYNLACTCLVVLIVSPGLSAEDLISSSLSHRHPLL